MIIFEFESVCAKEEGWYKETETTKWSEKLVPTSVSSSSNLIQAPIFRCNTYLHHSVSSFIFALEGVATQSKAQMKLKFVEIETAIKKKLCAILERMNRRQNRAEGVIDFVLLILRNKIYLPSICKCKGISSSSYRNSLNATVMDEKVFEYSSAKKIRFWSSPISYRFLCSNKTLNRQL